MKISEENKFGISKNVFVMGLVSFFNDVASEMLYPIVPIFLTSILGAPASVVGLIEGIAESTASILKVISGWYSDKFQKRKPFVTAGYSLSSSNRGAFVNFIGGLFSLKIWLKIGVFLEL